MTDERFRELVNLYLDDEISTAELREFSAALAAHAGRKADFQQRCRLHRAVRLVYDPQPVSSSSSVAPSLGGRFMFGVGLVACVALAVVVTPSLLEDVVSVALYEVEPLEAEDAADLSLAGLDRFASRPRVAVSDVELASVTAHLRLLGLRPELLSQPQALQSVNPASLQPRDTQARELERFSQWSQASAGLDVSSSRSALRTNHSPMRMGGFQTSLVGFK